MAWRLRSRSWHHLDALAGKHDTQRDRPAPCAQRDGDAAAAPITHARDHDRAGALKRYRHRHPGLSQDYVLHDPTGLDGNRVAIGVHAVGENDPSEATLALEHRLFDLLTLRLR